MASPLLKPPPVLKTPRPRKSKTGRHAGRSDTLAIGFVPMIDCAPLIAAKELGLFEKHGVNVALRKEIGWATIREKLLHDELQAAHAPASMGFVIRCGIGSVARPCLTGFVLSLNGSAITLSKQLYDRGVRDAASLREVIEADRGSRTYVIGAVLEYSTQNYNIRSWLKAGGIDPDRDVRMTIVPSPLIHRALLEGHLDGYCVAEPWNSIAVEAGAGWIAATTAEIAPAQPEKVLLVMEAFAETHHDEHIAIIAALIEASIFCESPGQRTELIKMLAHSRYLDVPPALLSRSLQGPLETGSGARTIDRFVTFQANGANVPDRPKGRRIYEHVREQPASHQCTALRPDVISRIFREDLYREAEKLTGPRDADTVGKHFPVKPKSPSPEPTTAPPVAMAG